MRSYDPSKPSLYLIYLDVSNLFGWTMWQLLPCWFSMSPRRLKFQWDDHRVRLSDILKVNSKYPQHLHVHTTVRRDKSPGKRQNKLLATLYDKKRYIIITTYSNIHGLRVKKRFAVYYNSRNLHGNILNTKFKTFHQKRFWEKFM